MSPAYDAFERGQIDEPTYRLLRVLPPERQEANIVLARVAQDLRRRVAAITPHTRPRQATELRAAAARAEADWIRARENLTLPTNIVAFRPRPRAQVMLQRVVA